MVQTLGSLLPTWESWTEFFKHGPALATVSGHLESEPTDGRSLFISLSCSFSLALSLALSLPFKPEHKNPGTATDPLCDLGQEQRALSLQKSTAMSPLGLSGGCGQGNGARFQHSVAVFPTSPSRQSAAGGRPKEAPSVELEVSSSWQHGSGVFPSSHRGLSSLCAPHMLSSIPKPPSSLLAPGDFGKQWTSKPTLGHGFKCFRAVGRYTWLLSSSPLC